MGLKVKIDLNEFNRKTEEAKRKTQKFSNMLKIVPREMDNISSASGKASLAMSTLSKESNIAITNAKRLAKELIALIGVYKTLNTAMSYVRRGMDFSASLESSQTAIASVIAATNKITTAQGKNLVGVEKFNAAEQISAEMMKEIQVLALQTTATFDSLVEGVSGIVAPATKAGVSLEKLPKFAVTAAQAMSTMKIPVQQMRTEIESLLSGNINKAQDLLATNLGISGEMVRNWQKQGTLIEELEKRLSSFAIAGQKVADNWDGLKSNMEDALDYISGQTGKGIFEGAKQSYREIINMLVSTQGEVGVGKDVQNIVNAITELENEIGGKLLDVTRQFIDYIKELNDPENLSSLKDTISNIWGATSDVASRIGSFSSIIGNIISQAADGWNRLPDTVREVGLVAAILAGPKGIAIIGSMSELYSAFSNTIEGIALVQEGVIRNQDIMFMNSGELASFLKNLSTNTEYLKKREEELTQEIAATKKELESIDGFDPWGYQSAKVEALTGKLNGLKNALNTIRGLFSSGSVISNPNGETGGTPLVMGSWKPKPELKTTSAIGGYEPKGKKGKTEAEKFAERSARYASGLEKLRNEVSALESSLDPTLTKLERMKKQIEAERDAAILNADVKAAETVRRKEATEAQAQETAQLEKHKATLIAAQKLDDLQNQNLRDKADFYKQLADKTGEYDTSIEYQTQLLEKQRQVWETLGLPVYDINKMLEILRLEMSKDPFDGAIRGLKKYEVEATNLAQGFEQATTNMLDGISGAFQITTDGLVVNWNNAMTTMANDFLQIFMRNIVGNIANSGMDWLGSFFNSTFNGLTKSAASGAAATSGYAGMGFRYSGGSALGNVFSGGDLSLYRNSIVSSPTFFTHDRHISRYAKGAGLMGEAGPEAVMPLVRTSGGNLGVRAEGTGNITPQINIQVINQTGTNATAEVQQQRNAQGGMDVVVLLKREMASDIARGGVLDQTIRGRYGVKPVVRGR
ncbi:phage tail tape measure C-terminal domain-containing protein [Bilophila wadsworthia]|uniref:phage tail tape measure C-terminal domain-containing protein n=1 Tax=Bilophila wadsworthia TaxID=35833 RepID=UPI002665173E|nr:phage tail tape measure C-terminal domain-containing protein [Bilophila wadsworthia]